MFHLVQRIFVNVLHHLEETGVVWNCQMPFEFLLHLEVFVIVDGCCTLGQSSAERIHMSNGYLPDLGCADAWITLSS